MLQLKIRNVIIVGKRDIRVTIVPIQEVMVVELELVGVVGVLVGAMAEAVVEAVVDVVVLMWQPMRILCLSL